MPDPDPTPLAPHDPRGSSLSPHSPGFSPVVPPTPRSALPTGTAAIAAPPRPSSPAASWPSSAAATPRFDTSATARSHGSGPARALGIASLALGALALLVAVVPVLNVASAAFAATGAGLGIAALFQLNRSRGIALSGVIVSIVALTTSVTLATVYSGVVTNAVSGFIEGAAELPVIIDEEVDETIATVDPDGASGTPDDPVPLGDTLVVTRAGEPRWEITLTGATYDAEDEVLRDNAASDVIADLTGEPAQYAYVTAEITYLGEDAASMYEEVYVCFTAADETYFCAGETVAVAPGTDLGLREDVEPGETVEGNFLMAIPADAEEGGHWTVAGQWTEFLYVATS